MMLHTHPCVAPKDGLKDAAAESVDAKGVEEGGASLEVLAPVLCAGGHHLEAAEDSADGDDVRVAGLEERREQADGLLIELEAVEGVLLALLSLDLAGGEGEDGVEEGGGAAGADGDLDAEGTVAVEHVEPGGDLSDVVFEVLEAAAGGEDVVRVAGVGGVCGGFGGVDAGRRA